ncbi:serine/threonine-protein kinase [Sphaerothrix gracilis]|uniref:serine/threonine protein kinase n=1 Tax=Sphaerothrix gracilis TaxID=3151835 RepID=UPI0031FC1CC2
MLQPKQVIHNRFCLERKLNHVVGRQTWLATDLVDKHLPSVIIKLSEFVDQGGWRLLDLLEREAQILKKVNHSRIPKYLDYFSVDDNVFWFGLVQQYVPGLTLKELLDQGEVFPEQRIRQIAHEVLEILIYLHELSPPILHRDIKPSNLIFGENNSIYLIDFGAAQNRATREEATFTVVGTYGYTAIEQFGGRAIPSSDLYSLGATLVHLVTGVSPADLPQQNLRIQFAERVSLNPTLIDFLEKLVNPDPDGRFRTARQALSALKTGNSIIEVRKDNDVARKISSYKISSLEIRDNSDKLPAYSRLKVIKTIDEFIIQVPVRFLWIKYFNCIYFDRNSFIDKPVYLKKFQPRAELNIFELNHPRYRRDYNKKTSRLSRFLFNAFRSLIEDAIEDSKASERKTSLIENVCLDFELSDAESTVYRRYKLIICMKNHEKIEFLLGLSRKEYVWLVDEIRDWLGIENDS